MSPKIQIRPAQPEDAADISRLNAFFNGYSEPPGVYLPRLVDTHRVDIPLLA